MLHQSGFHTVYLGLGTNLGDKEANIALALRLIAERIGVVEACSGLHATAPWGFVSDNNFINAAVRVGTRLTAEGVLKATQAIELEMGRRHKTVERQYSDRIIDIDILLIGNENIATTDLTVPHPLMLEREFVMQPLLEVLDAEGQKTVRRLIEKQG